MTDYEDLLRNMRILVQRQYHAHLAPAHDQLIPRIPLFGKPGVYMYMQAGRVKYGHDLPLMVAGPRDEEDLPRINQAMQNPNIRVPKVEDLVDSCISGLERRGANISPEEKQKIRKHLAKSHH